MMDEKNEPPSIIDNTNYEGRLDVENVNETFLTNNHSSNGPSRPAIKIVDENNKSDNIPSDDEPFEYSGKVVDIGKQNGDESISKINKGKSKENITFNNQKKSVRTNRSQSLVVDNLVNVESDPNTSSDVHNDNECDIEISSKLAKDSELDDIEEDDTSHVAINGPGEFLYSWNGPGSSRTREKHERYRSKSWCGPRSGIEGGADLRLLRERLRRTQLRPQPAAIKHFTRSQKMTLASLALVDFISFCSMSIMAPFFPREALEKGMSEAVSGFVFSFYALIMFLTSPLFGKIIPIVGAKYLFITGTFVAGTCSILFGFLEYIYDYETFATYCFLIRGFEAIGASAYSTASYVFVVNAFPNNIGSVLGILETFVGLGMSVGPAIGGLLYTVGGFGLPFYVLGVTIVIFIPINYFLLPSEDFSVETKSGSIIGLIKVPAVIITSLVIIVVSNTWSFLDPTLEPHLRQFNLSVKQVGLIFLLFSGLYGLFSPIWGWLADRLNRHWCMMVWGLLMCTVGLLLLGPSPLLPFLEGSVILNMIGLSIIGISVALTLLPTFQGVLSSAIEEGGCGDNLATYSVVAGVWSCMYSLGEVIGPALGGVLLKNYGFPICSTVMAGMTFVSAIITFTFFLVKETAKLTCATESTSDAHVASETETYSNGTKTFERSDSDMSEHQPLLQNSSDEMHPHSSLPNNTYGGIGSTQTVANTLNNVQNGTTDKKDNYLDQLNMNYLIGVENESFEIEQDNKKYKNKRGYNPLYSDFTYYNLINDNESNKNEDINHMDECGNSFKMKYKKNGTGLPPKLCNKFFTKHISDSSHSRHDSTEVLKYNMDKVKYYGQSRKADFEELFLDKNEETDVRGTVNITSSGACEV